MPEEGREKDLLARYHERTRSRGVGTLVYWAARAVLQPAIQLWFRLSRQGRHHVPDGPVILAANHRSFLDPFVIACCLRRPIYFMAERELLENSLQAWFLNCLGAFPVRRGERTRSPCAPRSSCSVAVRRS